MKKIIIFTLLVTLFFAMGCNKEKKEDVIDNSFDVGEVIDIFELSLQHPYEFIYNNKTIHISLQNVIDSADIDCSLVDFINDEDRERLKTYAYLNVNENSTVVPSIPCGGLGFKEDGQDIQDVSDRIDQFAFAPANETNSSYFKNAFMGLFGQGGVVEHMPYKIFMAKSSPKKYNLHNAHTEDYKFIFILTTKKSKS